MCRWDERDERASAGKRHGEFLRIGTGHVMVHFRKNSAFRARVGGVEDTPYGRLGNGGASRKRSCTQYFVCDHHNPVAMQPTLE